MKKKIVFVILIIIIIIICIYGAFFIKNNSNKNILQILGNTKNQNYGEKSLNSKIIKIEEDINDYYVEGEKCIAKIKFENIEENEEYQVKYQVNTEKEKELNIIKEGIYEVEFELNSEMENQCKITIIKGDNVILENLKQVLYIKKYRQQFLEQFNNTRSSSTSKIRKL